MTKISAKIVADSKNEFGNRITTFVLTFPRYILAEFNTHRVISKNSASSRAIPFLKMLKSVETNPFIPIAWMKDHKGMQGSDYFNEEESKELEALWLEGRDGAVAHALKLADKNLTKQLVNRTLEPYMWHTVICSATDYENYVALRASEFADIHIQKLAYEMLAALNESTPVLLRAGQWHIPFGDQFDTDKLYEIYRADTNAMESSVAVESAFQSYKIKIATARCARISYTIVGDEGKAPDYAADIKLHDRLASSGHYSPFEHAAMSRYWSDSEVSGNFIGFIQYRKTLANENKTDARVLKK